MFKGSIGAAVAAAILASSVPLACAQAQTPTTKVLAIGTIVPGANLQRAQGILPSEVRATVQLYLDGKVDQWFSVQDRNGVAFIHNVGDVKAARALLEALPLGKAHLMTFEVIPLGPLNHLRQLLTAPAK